MRHRRLLLVLSLILTAMVLCACSAQPLEPQGYNHAASQSREGQNAAGSNVRIIATRHFGQELIFDRELELATGISAMAALEKVAAVETRFGGGFVNSIDGIHSGFSGGRVKTDWFIYVNGIQCNVGALDYKLHPGDIERWDFHEWSLHQSIPAIVGDFPEPFWHGYGGSIRPTLVVYSDSLKEAARKLESRLRQMGVADAGIRSFAELSVLEKEYCNLILMDTGDNRLISEVDRNWKRMGFFTRTENRKVAILNTRGELAVEYGTGAGVIQATQSPWNPNGVGACENVVWVVTGTDETGVANAIEALLKHTAKFHYAFAAVAVNGEIIRIPQ